MSEWDTPEEQRAKRRAAKETRQRLAQDDAVLQSVMNSQLGRQYMYDLLAFCQIWNTVANVNPHFTYLAEGKRQVGLKLLDDIMRACPEAYIVMIQESSRGRREPEPPVDKWDTDDERNYDDAGRWIGGGDPNGGETDWGPSGSDQDRT
jgi:hypothetical protein